MMKPEQHLIADEIREPVVPRQGVSLLNAMLGLEGFEHSVSTNTPKKKPWFYPAFDATHSPKTLKQH